MTRDEVLREFGAKELESLLPAAMAMNLVDMADAIVHLRERLSAVDSEREQAYQVAQQNEATARRLKTELDGLRERLEAVQKAHAKAMHMLRDHAVVIARAERMARVCEAARKWLATNDAFFEVSVESRSFGSELDSATSKYAEAVRVLTAEVRALDTDAPGDA